MKGEPGKCINCGYEDFTIVKKYCTKCYPLTLKIDKIERNILPDFCSNLDPECYSYDKIKKECIAQIKHRLRIIKDSRNLEVVSAHDLEYRINSTLNILDNKTLGKINDPLASYLRNDTSRAFVYQLFSKIQLLKPFKYNYNRILSEGMESEK